MSVSNLLTRRNRQWASVFVAVVAVAVVALAVGNGSRATASRSGATATSAVGQLGSGRGGYPRVIRLAHSGSADGALIASVTTTGGVEAIFRSTNDGVSFSRVGSIAEPAGQRGQCCGSLYELPRRIGTMPAGTLLFAASYGAQTPPMSIRLFASTDRGSTWHAVSTVVKAPAGAPPTEGVWEPEMLVDPAGELVVYFSDQTQPGHSQALMERTSASGRTWSRSQPVVELAAPSAEPGMAVVNPLPDGTLFMTYELCTPVYGCIAAYRTSRDGVHWGNPASPGTPIIATNGDWFKNTPNTTVIKDGKPGGEILLVGHYYYNSDHQPAAGNGDTLLVNRDGGAGPWKAMHAPIAVPVVAKCANYSSSLLATHHSTEVLEIAQVETSPIFGCAARYATEQLPAWAQP
ncbi:MAG TPA: sialidase family protein [Streptosporangiaceae bacterium]|jgi:hypothetical protein|nr:sialidase family protein [Streptosporangiaceae bacterium]